jgi:hypothetical protein
MKRILPILLFIVSACSNSRQLNDVYGTNAGSVSHKNDSPSYRSASSPGFSDTVKVKEEVIPCTEQINDVDVNSFASKRKSEVNKEEVPNKQEAKNQQLQIANMALQLASLNSTIAVQRTQRNPTAQDQLKMNNDVQLLGKLAPASFEYNLYAYVSGNYDASRVAFLQKAAELQPSNKDVVLQYAAYYLSIDDKKGTANYLYQWERSLPKDQKEVIYAKDLLNSVQDNGILIVHGINDSYSALYQQFIKKVRTDVQVISLELLQSEQYKKTLNDKGVKLPNSELIDRSFLEEFCQLNKEKNLFLSMTIPKEYLSGMTSRLFAVGLAFEYSEQTELDNFYRNELLWNHKFSRVLVDELEQEENNNGSENQLVANYLPMLLQMRQVYIQRSELERVKEMDKVLDQIGKSIGKTDIIEKIKQGQQ